MQIPIKQVCRDMANPIQDEPRYAYVASDSDWGDVYKIGARLLVGCGCLRVIVSKLGVLLKGLMP